MFLRRLLLLVIVLGWVFLTVTHQFLIWGTALLGFILTHMIA